MYKKVIKNKRDLSDFEKTISEAQNKGLTVFTDGSMDNRSDTNDMKFSYAIYEVTEVIETKVLEQKYNGKRNSINKAEALGIIYALAFLDENNCNNERITFFTDSKIVYNICRLRKPPKSDSIFYSTCLSLLRGIERFSDLHFEWIPRELNEYADGLMRKELA